eukprot:TRINITY_DN105237_c0_g1_i1.p1 TRINITY_DN105237_c0_g1~~TRINITY_DN105237_c0_g1_i1.p1  ORF type:complete len:503 (-),score=113.56 TRINITY_DN105237_c0_g1_i1:392-1786(-)
MYEPMGSMHHDKPVWVSRDVQPIYIFHTGKTRWVVSKRIDDGAKCYAYLEDNANTPAGSRSSWTCIDQDNQWRADQNVHCTPVPSSSDTFVQLRMSLEGEMQKYGFNDLGKLRQLWKRLDFNGNNIVSLAEIDKMVVEMVAGGTWPSWLNNKPALMRAYKKTILKDGNGDDWVQKREFHNLLLNIFWFNKLWHIFDVIDTGDDRRIDVGEFSRGLSQLGLHMSPGQAQQEFSQIDTNHGGQVLFVEFCAYVRHRVHPDGNQAIDADIMSGEHAVKALRSTHSREIGTMTYHVARKNLGMFEEMEQKFKAIMQDRSKLLKLWHLMDFNGNNIVSLAEIDKLMVEQYPVLNHKPALMRAYKAAIRSDGDHDEWVEKHEFKKLLGFLIYFNKLFWIFDNADGDKDRRITYDEFKWCLNTAGAKMSESEIKSDFNRVDRNGGGIILFDEFCKYFTMKACPECLTAMAN